MAPEPNNAASRVATPAMEQEPELPVFRFSLRHMFWTVTLIGVVLASVVAVASTAYASLALLLAILVVGLHITGTTIGFRLREHADRRLAWESGHERLKVTPTLPVTAPSPLHGRAAATPRLWAFTACGAIVGGALGAILLAATIGHRTTAVGIAVGAISTAILGGWVAFLAASFWVIFRQGWREAVEVHRQDTSRRSVLR